MSKDAYDQTFTKPPPKALIFDLMGTCLDWHKAIVPTLQHALPSSCAGDASKIALHWRKAFFDRIHARFEAGCPQEDIDETHRRTLSTLLNERGHHIEATQLEACVRAWHVQKAWPDVIEALPVLRSAFDLIVLANGTTRLQVDITKSAGLSFDLLLSSELLNYTKPDPAIYHKALDLIKLKPEECVMVAAHAYDPEAAKKVGMRTVYTQRWTEDVEIMLYEDSKKVVIESNDLFIDAREATNTSGGLIELAKMLGLRGRHPS